MKQVTDVVKKFFMVFGAVALGVISIFCLYKCFVPNRHNSATYHTINHFEKKENEEIEVLAEIRKKEVSDYISNTSPSDISAGWEAVRGTIARGIERFHERCALYGTSDENSRGRNKEDQ